MGTITQFPRYRAESTRSTASRIACYIYQSYIYTLVLHVGSPRLYILLHIHDVLHTGQISPGYPHPQDLTAPKPAFRVPSACFRIHRMRMHPHQGRRHRQEGSWKPWCRSEQTRQLFGLQRLEGVSRYFLQHSLGQLNLEVETEEETWV